MPKKKKQSPPPGHVAPKVTVAGKPSGSAFEEVLRHPTLLAATVTAALAMFAVWTTIRYHDDMSMGAMREPTSIILWSAISATLFLRYRREKLQETTRP
jgi:hypothetical protein